MFIKFFTLIFLAVFISCTPPNSGNVKKDTIPDEDKNSLKLVSISIRGDLSVMDDQHLALYFRNSTRAEKHFGSQSDLLEFNSCIVLPESNFSDLFIRLQLKDRKIECDNAPTSPLKCSSSIISNHFLDLPEKSSEGNIVIQARPNLLISSARKNPEIDKCFKLF